MKTIATFHSPFATKFGIPRQAGVVPQVMGKIVFEKDYRTADAIRGMEQFDFLWLIWGFSANRHEAKGVTVRPPRLGGNTQLGVFATRSPFRPNPIGLSSVAIHHIDYDAAEAPVIYVTGADLMDGTPIYDIKPYIPYTDAHPSARGGFTDKTQWQKLSVIMDASITSALQQYNVEAEVLRHILEQDPRPQYHNDPLRIYGMEYGGCDIRFMVNGNTLTVVEIKKL